MANLGQILKQLQRERSRTQKELNRLDNAIAAIKKLVGNNPGPARARKPRARRKLSAAARRKISRAQKARWAKTAETEGWESVNLEQTQWWNFCDGESEENCPHPSGLTRVGVVEACKLVVFVRSELL